MDRLISTTLQSQPLTHARLKYLAALAEATEDHVSRLGLALSITRGPVDIDWRPLRMQSENILMDDNNEKHLRGRTLFKDDLSLWMALILRNQSPADYNEWRQVMRAHWERGVEILMSKNVDEGDWLRTIRACLPS
jgi:hypothetical protein